MVISSTNSFVLFFKTEGVGIATGVAGAGVGLETGGTTAGWEGGGVVVATVPLPVLLAVLLLVVVAGLVVPLGVGFFVVTTVPAALSGFGAGLVVGFGVAFVVLPVFGAVCTGGLGTAGFVVLVVGAAGFLIRYSVCPGLVVAPD